MFHIFTNFGKESKCFCGEKETMSHICNCRKMIDKQERIEFQKVLNFEVIQKKYENKRK